eukprot:g14332.t1
MLKWRAYLELVAPTRLDGLRYDFMEVLGGFDFKELFRFEKPHFRRLLAALELPPELQIMRELGLSNSAIASRCPEMHEYGGDTPRQYVGAICKLLCADNVVVKALTPYYDRHTEGRESLFNCSTFQKGKLVSELRRRLQSPNGELVYVRWALQFQQRHDGGTLVPKIQEASKAQLLDIAQALEPTLEVIKTATSRDAVLVQLGFNDSHEALVTCTLNALLENWSTITDADGVCPKKVEDRLPNALFEAVQNHSKTKKTVPDLDKKCAAVLSEYTKSRQEGLAAYVATLTSVVSDGKGKTEAASGLDIMPKEMPHTTNIEPPAHNKEKLPFEGEDDHNEDVATRAGGGEAESTANSDNNVHVAAGGTTRHDEPVTNTTADQRGEDTPEDGSQSSGTAGGMWDSMAETTAPIPLPGGKEPASSPRKDDAFYYSIEDTIKAVEQAFCEDDVEHIHLDVFLCGDYFVPASGLRGASTAFECQDGSPAATVMRAHLLQQGSREMLKEF